MRRQIAIIARVCASPWRKGCLQDMPAQNIHLPQAQQTALQNHPQFPGTTSEVPS